MRACGDCGFGDRKSDTGAAADHQDALIFEQSHKPFPFLQV